ncbi:TIGR04219 family outer membrane beta-barrel protein [Candidatus Sororendozoicomonas aggregata]|uniref:TIGR04219 family outer membrane beta-barrel protein n=1 Tax=Candidatus Sororendozoicomonas aggregata TaxID=3073239 RepID=UPI002ED526DD
MKKVLCTTALLLTASINCHGDMIGAKVGYDYWKTANHSDSHSVYAQVEHPFPLVPNLALQANKIDSHKLKLNSYDVSGYYEILDNDNLSVDLGLGLRRLDSGRMYDQSFTDTLPMVTADMTLFPGSSLSFYGKINAGKSNDSTITDASAGVRFTLLAGISLQASYRSYELDLDGTKGINDKETIRGPQIGLDIDF